LTRVLRPQLSRSSRTTPSQESGAEARSRLTHARVCLQVAHDLLVLRATPTRREVQEAVDHLREALRELDEAVALVPRAVRHQDKLQGTRAPVLPVQSEFSLAALKRRRRLSSG
jgi:hypothetical protein